MTDVCMVVRNPATHDSRVHREALTLAGAGLDVVVLAATGPGLPLRERLGGYVLERLGEVTPPGSAAPDRSFARQLAREVVRGRPGLHTLVIRLLTAPGRMRFALETYERLRALRPSVIHSHDLDTLGVAAVAAREVGARLVYDSHELFAEVESGLPAPVRFLERRAYRALESSLISRADAVLATSPGTADWLQQAHGIPAPEVLLNAPAKTELEGGRDLRAAVGATGPLLVYVGSLTKNRGLEESIASLPRLDGAELVLLGPDKNGTATRLRDLAASHRVLDRVHVLPPVPRDAIVGSVRGADVGLVPIVPAGASYRLSLPNKLFECAFAGVPVVASDLPVLGHFVREHKLGVTIADRRTATFTNAVRTALAGRAPRLDGAGLAAFIDAHCWERQGERLVALYRRLGAA